MFHDVDLILENDKAIYNCFNDEKIVWHYSGYIDKFKYRLLYQYLFGGSKLKHLVKLGLFTFDLLATSDARYHNLQAKAFYWL